MIYTIAQGWLPKFDLDLDLDLDLYCSSEVYYSGVVCI